MTAATATTTADASARRRLIEAKMPLVRGIAQRFARRGEPLEDLIQVGCIGLIHAVDRYDPDRGHAFDAYAVPTIAGEIRRHLRDRGSGLRLPRGVLEEQVRVYRARAELERRTGRTPSAGELARVADVTPEAVASALDPPRLEPFDDDAGPLADPIAELETHLALRAAIRLLPPREQRILLLSFYGERSQRAIARELGLSQIHVSRLLRRAIDRLRSTLEGGRAVAHRAGEA
jgi:RNA polymerase sigma-B factor